MALLWDDRIEDFNEFLDVCAHDGCDEIVESMHYQDPESGRLVQYGGRARYCWYHASSMWVKRRQRAKAE
jgi:hypothetical protein